MSGEVYIAIVVNVLSVAFGFGMVYARLMRLERDFFWLRDRFIEMTTKEKPCPPH